MNIKENVESLISRGAQAIWIGGDNTVEMGINVVVDTARKGKVPVICNNPEHVLYGAIFGIGANYFEVGKQAGYIAADILGGKDPALVSIENVVPKKLFINKKLFSEFKEKWIIPQEIEKIADKIIE